VYLRHPQGSRYTYYNTQTSEDFEAIQGKLNTVFRRNALKQWSPPVARVAIYCGSPSKIEVIVG